MSVATRRELTSVAAAFVEARVFLRAALRPDLDALLTAAVQACLSDTPGSLALDRIVKAASLAADEVRRVAASLGDGSGSALLARLDEAPKQARRALEGEEAAPDGVVLDIYRMPD